MTKLLGQDRFNLWNQLLIYCTILIRKLLLTLCSNWLGVYVYFGLFFIIFAETGLAVGFFLPGDSLLVVAGLFAAAGKLNLWMMLVSLFVAAVVGDAVGYYSGRKMGKAIFSRPKSRFFNPKHLRESARLLRKIRRQNDHHRALRSNCSHVRADCRGRGGNALSEIFYLTTFSAVFSG